MIIKADIYYCKLCGRTGYVNPGEIPDSCIWGIPTVDHDDPNKEHDWVFQNSQNIDDSEGDNVYIG